MSLQATLTKENQTIFFSSCIRPRCNSLCVLFLVFFVVISHPFYFSSSFFSFLRILSISVPFSSPVFLQRLTFSLSLPLSFSVILSFRYPALFLQPHGAVLAGRLNYRACVQVFFKERITRSIFTASFSLSSCLPSRRFLLPVSLRGCASSRIQGIKETVNGRSKLFTNVISFTPCRAFCTSITFYHVCVA